MLMRLLRPLPALAGAAIMFVTLDISAAERPDSFADQAEALSPAVVNISTTTIVNDGPSADMPQFPPGSPFEDFFRNFGDDNRQRRASSLGSGFIIDDAGIVVTNFHVIENAEEITVTLADETTFVAEVLGQDQKTDIAVLKIDPGDTQLTAVPFGDSDNLRVGDWVLAIGNPFGLGGTVTAGIVSARGRDIGNGPYDDFIQTDASINRGNSGGPLFNLDGEVIGINTAIFSQSGGSVGIGFAISSNLAKRVTQQLAEYGTTRRGWLGVFIQEVTPEIAESLGLDEAGGALVSSVNDKSPAKAAGLEPGDVITSFDGKKIDKMRDLPRIVAETDIGATVDVELVRNGSEMTVQVTLGELEKAELVGLIGEGEQETGSAESFDKLGFAVEDLTATLAEEYGLDPETRGVIVTEVVEGGPASAKGLEVGNIIKRFGQRQVEDAADLAKSVAETQEAGRAGVLLLVESDGRERFIQIGFAKE
ncbi:MAG: DegQ family serine endoprotease [Pseudomonadota bacterium]|nr:DegQ family serine endoprotease [Pseudomonadota bacterium]